MAVREQLADRVVRLQRDGAGYNLTLQAQVTVEDTNACLIWCCHGLFLTRKQSGDLMLNIMGG